jgi:hypothetical protein
MLPPKIGHSGKFLRNVSRRLKNILAVWEFCMLLDNFQ